MEFSLCIPTMNRWNFLNNNIPLYLKNNFIKEIIIFDETGEDYEKIKINYSNEKIKVYKNEKRLGPFLNKLECMKRATCDWICLMDSDNFANISYFDSFMKYVNGMPSNDIIYCPSCALPNFNFTSLQDRLITKKNIKHILNSNKKELLEITFNTGNYILNKKNINIINTFLINDEVNQLSKICFPCDVIYMNYLLLMNGQTFIVVPNMYYEHVVHDESIYLKTCDLYNNISDKVHNMFRDLINQTDEEYSLKEWKQIDKPLNNLLFNCSEFKYCNDEWVPFTIGMGVHLINYKGNISSILKQPSEHLILCAINDTTDQKRRPEGYNRKLYIENLKKNNIKNVYLNYNTYIENLAKYKFVISPEGNGIDCHRHYEALIAGCIPIIEDNPLIREKYKGLPILYTKDYSEITQSYLEKTYNSMINQKYDFSSLYLNNYSLEEKKIIKENGNYWANRIYNRYWYNDFNWKYYLDAYPDLTFNGVHTEEQAIQHWINHGKKEGRTCFFNWKYYLDAYPDLRFNGVHTEKQAIQHWINHGKKEGRTCF
jgi:hypothetical protein